MVEVDRQTLLFFIIMFIFLSLPSGHDQPHSTKERETLVTFQQQLLDAEEELALSQYSLGYGNITGFHLSYQDLLDGKSAKDWPLHDYGSDNEWIEDQKDSILPNSVSSKVKNWWGSERIKDHDNDRAYLLNISGRAHGEFQKVKDDDLVKYNFKLPPYLKEYYDNAMQIGNGNGNDASGYDEENGNKEDDKRSNNDNIITKVGNITVPNGKISIGIKSYGYNFINPDFSKYIQNKTSDEIDDAMVINLKLNLKDYEEIEDHEFETRGIYFQETGSLISVSRSAKFLGFHGLSHLTLNDSNFIKAKTLMSQFLNTSDIRHDFSMDDMNGYIIRSQEQCEIITYFQFEKTDYTWNQLRFIDDELINPSGKPIPNELPNLTIKDYLIYSPDCGIILTKTPEIPFVGLKSEVLNKKLRSLLVGILLLVFIQLLLFLRQIKNARTPGQLSTIASKTLFIIGFQDSLVALMFLLVSTLIEDLYLLIACVAVIAFIMCGIFELRFMVSVLTTQVNERGTTWWEILRGSTNGGETTTAEGTTTPTDNGSGPILPIANPPRPPPTTTTTTTATTTPAGPGWEEASFSNSIFAGGFSLTIVATFLILNSLVWRIQYRRIFEYVGLILLNSYWIPQFFRNTLKNKRQSFTWEFVFGTSIIRLIPIYYFNLVKSNPLRHHYDPVLVAVTTIWVVFQLTLLVLQYQLGPRFWVNEKWLPKAYDYQRVIHFKDLESGFSSEILNSISSSAKVPTTGGRESPTSSISGADIIESKCTCPICMTDITLPIVNTINDKNGVSENELKKMKKTYMITPCFHIFHNDCLENWMKYKLQCPVCRESLPPI
ncbi:uncharacterized protein RJT21DRAFT_118629 [Scheffersomyces amazonensis]|uniref:uncharacterized protein n=1 Tax=Scheffersomyces amazonensis TaxID=1078765 RepID=UPI00315CED5C